jgi:hypothetical protein
MFDNKWENVIIIIVVVALVAWVLSLLPGAIDQSFNCKP